ncbi:hypothetical protein AB6813_22045 [bacterium RCC_150]
MKFLTLTATALTSIAAFIAFFSNPIVGFLWLAAAVASLTTWLAYKKQTERRGKQRG